MIDTSRTTFSVKNLGAIKSGRFTVKPLTLFCGPNNTGKTWLMYALYAFWRRGGIPKLQDIDALLGDLQNEGAYRGSIREWLEDNANEYIKAASFCNASRFVDIFNTDEALFKDSRFMWKIDQTYFIESVLAKGLKVHDHNVLRINKSKNSDYLEVTRVSNGEIDREELRFNISNIATRLLLDQRRPFLMPAERNGLHLFFRELRTKRTALLHHASKEKIDLSQLFQDVMKSRYALPIADYIDWLNSLHDFQKRNSSPFHTMAKAVRCNVSRGRYTVNREGDILFRPNKLNRDTSEPAPQNMGLHTTSSTVKSLFGLWFYLENQANPGDVLMIDEPELHLHPSHQRELARILSQLTNEGLWVIISTHSDYLVREINSLMMLNVEHSERDALMKTHRFKKEQLLDKNKVAAYLVEDRQVSPMEITPDEGIIADTFDNVINNLNDSSNDIYYKYKEDEQLNERVTKHVIS